MILIYIILFLAGWGLGTWFFYAISTKDRWMEEYKTDVVAIIGINLVVIIGLGILIYNYI